MYMKYILTHSFIYISIKYKFLQMRAYICI